jgi:hypothetical protein
MTPNDNINNEDIQEKAKKDFQSYKQTLMYMSADVPIEVLCLPKAIENALLREGCLRVYDMFNRDLAKIKGIGRSRIHILIARLDQFLTMAI